MDSSETEQTSRLSYQLVFQPLALDVELHRGGTGTRAGTGARTGAVAAGTEVAAADAAAAAAAMGAAAVLRPAADLIDGDAAEASATQGKPPTAGVIPSHDHCSHTCITVTVRAGGRNERKKREGGG